MKITKTQLKEIIKEELSVLQEVDDIPTGTVTNPEELETMVYSGASGRYGFDREHISEVPRVFAERVMEILGDIDARLTAIEGGSEEEEEALRLPNPWDEPGGPIAFTNRVADRFRKGEKE